MSDLAVAFGLVLVIEGLIWALLPSFGKGILETALRLPEADLRLAGAGAIAVGVLIIWLVRG
jgi:uncharacterized protein YjeT (DUF2065 family)